MANIVDDEKLGPLDFDDKHSFESTITMLQNLGREHLISSLITIGEQYLKTKDSLDVRIYQTIASEVVSRAMKDDSTRTGLEEYVKFQHDRKNLVAYKQLWNGSFISDHGYGVFTFQGLTYDAGPSTLFLEDNFFSAHTSYKPKDFDELAASLTSLSMAFKGTGQPVASKMMELLLWIPRLAEKESDIKYAIDAIKKFGMTPDTVLALSKIVDYNSQLAEADRKNILPDGRMLRFVKKYLISK